MGKTLSEHNIGIRREKRRQKDSVNCLPEIFLELLNERKLQIKDVHEKTGIPYPTLLDWLTQKNKTQKLDGNILALSKFFNVSINYLAFGVGDDEQFYKTGNAND